MRALRLVVVWLLALVALGAVVVWLAGRGTWGRNDSRLLEPSARARLPAVVAAEDAAQRRDAAALGASADRQILFGDLHVHTTISFDAFMLNLPVMGGEGAHPPADACDFARHCAGLDFFSFNDHAENIHPVDWRNTVEAVRACNARAGDASDPDLVAFLGWEWTQAGATPDTHYGHKNVVLAHTDDARIPARPIAASAGGTAAHPPSVWARGALALQGGRFHDLARRWTELGGLATCSDGPVRSLPADCREIAPTPAELFTKLDDWGVDSIVIPHGTAWGIYTPPGARWDHQLAGAMHDPDRQTLIEVYSGHGASEVFRDWRDVDVGPDGGPVCPAARPDYLPMCQRAAQIVRARCRDAGEPAEECEARVDEARRHAVRAGISAHATVPGSTGRDWLDAGQCRDCAQPAFHYRPRSSAQYILALGGFDDLDAQGTHPDGGAGTVDRGPRRFRMGFIASSDIHTARAGTGYKELRGMTDAGNRAVDLEEAGIVGAFLRGPEEPPAARSRSLAEAREVLRGLQLYESERSQSFLYTGGLVAVHAEGRDRENIWRALERREVYGTSGPRMLLWFDLLDGDRRVPMGGEATIDGPPRFSVRAAGSFEQLPGCPASAVEALGAARLEQLCHGECRNPSGVRRPITRIDVVRIRPRIRPEEDVASLIDDPWRVFDCAPDPAGCAVEFDDPEFAALGRETVYYVRALEAPKPTVNGDPLRCEASGDDACVETSPCERGEECLAPDAPRAWSSPIWVEAVRDEG
jgi:hypothetical protein